MRSHSYSTSMREDDPVACQIFVSTIGSKYCTNLVCPGYADFQNTATAAAWLPIGKCGRLYMWKGHRPSGLIEKVHS